MVYTYNRVLLFSLKKGGDSDMCYNMNELWGHYVRFNKSVTKKANTIWFQLNEVLIVIKFMETESGMVVEGNREWGTV